MIHQGHRTRVKERFAQEGLSSFAPHEVLELLLFFTIPQKDVNPIAHELLNRFGSLEGVFSANKNALQNVKGIGEQSAAFLTLMLPLFEYYQLSKFGIKPNFTNRKALHSFCFSLLGHKKEEVFYVISLDAQMTLLQATPLSKGSTSQVVLSTRHVVETALHTGANSVVLCHNHPGGTLSPSVEDVESTKNIQRVLQTLDILLIDHIIVASGETLSLFSYISDHAYKEQS